MLLTPPRPEARARIVSTGRPSLLGRFPTAWRASLAALALITAAAHVPVTPDHLHEALYIGVLFIALEVVSVVLAVVLLVRPSRLALMGLAVIGAIAVLALVVSRTVGLPLIGDDIGNWAEPLAVVSLVVEALLTLGALAALRWPGRFVPTRIGVAIGLAVLMLGAAATAVATVVEYAPAPHATGSIHMSSDMPGMDMGLAAPYTAQV